MNTDQWKVSDVNKKGGEIQRSEMQPLGPAGQ